MDEAKLQEIEREIGLRYRLGPKDGWATRTMQDLISEVRRLKAENERLRELVPRIQEEDSEGNVYEVPLPETKTITAKLEHVGDFFPPTFPED